MVAPALASVPAVQTLVVETLERVAGVGVAETATVLPGKVVQAAYE